MEALIKALLYIAEKQNIHLAIDIDDGNVYEIVEGSEEVTRAHPITDPAQTVAIYDPSRLVTLNNTTALHQYCNDFLTALQQSDNDRETALQRAAIGTATDEQRIVNGFATDAEREFIGAGKVNLPPFSTNCPPEVEGVARKIEQLLRRAISNTNKPQTLENLMQIHRDAAKYAAAGNIFKLNQIESRLRGIVAKQGAIKTSEQTVRRRSFRRQLFAKIFIALVMLAGLVGYFWFTMPKGEHATIAGEVPASASPTLSALDAACLEFERETGRKVYPGGRACIERAAIDAGAIDNKNEIKKLLYKYVK